MNYLLTILGAVWITCSIIYIAKENASPYHDKRFFILEFICAPLFIVFDIIDEYKEWHNINKKQNVMNSLTPEGGQKCQATQKIIGIIPKQLEKNLRVLSNTLNEIQMMQNADDEYIISQISRRLPCKDKSQIIEIAKENIISVLKEDYAAKYKRVFNSEPDLNIFNTEQT